MAKRVWNIRYSLGNTGREIGDAGNPRKRSEAIPVAEEIAKRANWHVWVEHVDTRKRIWDSHSVAGKEASGGSLVSGPVSVEQQREMIEHNARQAREAGKKRSGT